MGTVVKQEPGADRKDSLLLRTGARIFRHLSRNRSDPESPDEVHILNPREQTQLKEIERSAILRAALIGTLAALICAFAWPAAVWILGPAPADAGFSEQWQHYLVTGILFTIATVVEIILLYWNTLVAVHHMAHAAGLRLFAERGEPRAVLNALVGAALELPNSREETLFARPGREVSRWWIILVAILYRLKVTFTYYLAKALVQRFMGRVVVRWAIELIAVPVYAFWDSVVTYRVLRQARVCAMGPSAVKTMAAELQKQMPPPGEEGRMAMLCAVGSTVARNSHLHPNVRLLLQELVNLYGHPQDAEIDNSENLLELLPVLAFHEKKLVIQTLSLALIIDGRASIWERKLLVQCLEASEMSLELEYLHRGLARFRNGQMLAADELTPRTARVESGTTSA